MGTGTEASSWRALMVKAAPPEWPNQAGIAQEYLPSEKIIPESAYHHGQANLLGGTLEDHRQGGSRSPSSWFCSVRQVAEAMVQYRK